MITDWTSIDDYFANRLSADERNQFDATLRTDEALAQAVAFYVAAKQTLRQEAQEQRRTELMARPVGQTRQLPWPYSIAAA
ncbi:MAG: hypothetical protein LH609_06780, partial [Rudanella sp.]|nr:hypothetical protein [Rudanella sp.]